MENYKPNSHKYREEQKEQVKVQKVVSGSVVAKKQTGFKKFTKAVVSEDLNKVKTYLIEDVVIPQIKETITKLVKNGIDAVFYGETGRDRKSSVPGAKVSYSSYYSSNKDRERSVSSVRSAFDYDEIVFSNRGDAELVLNQLDEAIDKYSFVTVGTLYDLAGITIHNPCVHNYGWTDLRSASVARVRDGYVLNLPKALAMD